MMIHVTFKGYKHVLPISHYISNPDSHGGCDIDGAIQIIFTSHTDSIIANSFNFQTHIERLACIVKI